VYESVIASEGVACQNCFRTSEDVLCHKVTHQSCQMWYSSVCVFQAEGRRLSWPVDC